MKRLWSMFAAASKSRRGRISPLRASILVGVLIGTLATAHGAPVGADTNEGTTNKDPNRCSPRGSATPVSSSAVQPSVSGPTTSARSATTPRWTPSRPRMCPGCRRASPPCPPVTGTTVRSRQVAGSSAGAATHLASWGTERSPTTRRRLSTSTGSRPGSPRSPVGRCTPARSPRGRGQVLGVRDLRPAG